MKRAKLVAEVSSNHHRDLRRCLEFVSAAADCGCHAIKFQQFIIRKLFAREALHHNPALLNREAWELPEVSFVAALGRTARDIVDPFPFFEVVTHHLSGQTRPVPLEQIASRRLVAKPVPADLASRFDDALRPEPEYYLAWTLPE